jgi:hypothetical protein
MNISGVIRSMIGELRPEEPKTLELKTGQVVKGVIVQMLSDREAVVNIGGVQVTAKLETSLKQGQVTMLQVQPEGQGGQVVLKPLQSSDIQIADDSLAHLLKEFGMKDQPGARQLLQQLHQAGIPLGKETIKAFIDIQGQKPAQVKPEQWLESAIVTHHKGAALTPGTVGAVHQAIFGAPLHETLEQLDSKLISSLQDGTADSWPAPVKELAVKAAQLLQLLRGITEPVQASEGGEPAAIEDGQAEHLSRTGSALLARGSNSVETSEHGFKQDTSLQGNLLEGSSSRSGLRQSVLGAPFAGSPATLQPDNSGASSANAPSTAAGASSGLSAGQAAPANGTTQHTVDQQLQQQQASTNSNARQPVAASSDRSESSSNAQRDTASGMTKAAGTDRPEGSTNTHRDMVAGTPKITGADQPESPANGLRDTVAGTTKTVGADRPEGSTNAQRDMAAGTPKVSAEPNKAADAGRSMDQPMLAETGRPQSDDNGNWIVRMLKTIGIDHENQAVKLLEHTGINSQLRADDSPGNVMSNFTIDQDGVPDLSKAADSLKSILLQLSSSDDAPPALKEAAHQTVQQITGQQLMLTADRTAMFAHLTLMVPMYGENGQQTASIHIQSRRGKKGELDADNCRLLFDLRMKAMGDTLVDVQVVDRIVSLNVHNNHPIVAELLESHRDEIASGLSSLGYQFISLKCSLYPEKTDASAASQSERSEQTASDFAAMQGTRMLVSSKSYKGMDIRI